MEKHYSELHSRNQTKELTFTAWELLVWHGLFWFVC